VKLKPGDKLIVHAFKDNSKPFLAEMVDYDPLNKSYLVIQEAKLSEMKRKEVPKIDFEANKDENEFTAYGDDSPAKINESIVATQVLGANEVLMNSIWVESKNVRKINMEPLSFIQKLMAKLFDL